MTPFPAGLPTGTPSATAPSARYILPQFEERTPYGFKRQDPYAKLFEDRIVFLGSQVDDASADDVLPGILHSSDDCDPAGPALRQ